MTLDDLESQKVIRRSRPFQAQLLRLLWSHTGTFAERKASEIGGRIELRIGFSVPLNTI